MNESLSVWVHSCTCKMCKFIPGRRRTLWGECEQAVIHSNIEMVITSTPPDCEWSSVSMQLLPGMAECSTHEHHASPCLCTHSLACHTFSQLEVDKSPCWQADYTGWTLKPESRISNTVPLRILIVLPCSKHCSADLFLKVGLIHAV